jgi:hypothetical protein
MNPLNDTLIAKTVLSPVFNFKEAQGEQNRAALINRVKKMPPETRQDLMWQLDRALSYVKAVKNNEAYGTFYDAALCSMLLADDELPVSKVGVFATIGRTILHGLGLRISSEDIANKVAKLRDELTKPGTHALLAIAFSTATPEGILNEIYDGGNNQAGVQQANLSQLVGEDNLPKVKTEVENLRNQFVSEVIESKNKWSDPNTLVQFLTSTIILRESLNVNPSLTQLPKLKNEIIKSIGVVADYREQQSAGANPKQLCEILLAYVKELKETGKYPSSLLAQYKQELERIAGSTYDEQPKLSMIEEEILKSYQMHCMNKAIRKLNKCIDSAQKQLVIINGEKTRAAQLNEKKRDRTTAVLKNS